MFEKVISPKPIFAVFYRKIGQKFSFKNIKKFFKKIKNKIKNQNLKNVNNSKNTLNKNKH